MSQDLKLIKPHRHTDQRGFFAEIYSKKDFVEYGIDINFLQDNHSLSWSSGTLRGLHFQAPPHAQAKLIRCARGAIFDVAVDIRRGSPTFRKWEGHVLSAENGHQFYIPTGFAHGFLTLQPDSEIVYKCSDYYAPQSEGAVLWNDPEIGIDWNLSVSPILSPKDAASPLLRDCKNPFVYGVNS